MKTKSLLYLLIALIISFSLQGQQTQLPDLMPNSPNVQEMQKYGDIPVGHYTGVPNISIPLYTIKSGDITVPITLSYHASGIKVAQEASWVGLGWTLNAGGSLSRQKRSFDDFGGAGTNSGHEILKNYHFRDPIIELNEDNKNGINLTHQQYSQYFEERRRDFFPDLYYYGFLGYSGKFIFDNFPQGTSVKRGDGLKFNIMNAGYHIPITDLDWHVKDLKGFDYSFNQPVTKRIISNNNLEAVDSYFEETTTSSWLLTAIKSPSNKEVIFEYKRSAGYRIHTPSTENTNSTLKIHSIFSNSNPNAILHDPHLPHTVSGSNMVSREHIDDVLLERIEFDEGYVLFETSTRDDLRVAFSNQKSEKLSEIRIYDKTNKLIKGIKFDYVYVNQPQNSADVYLYSKLCLQSVQEYHLDNNGDTVYREPHVFEYTQRPLNVAPIAKNSDLVDHWGYWGKRHNMVSETIIQKSDLDISINNNTPLIINDERHEKGIGFTANCWPLVDSSVVTSYEVELPGNNLNQEYLKHAVDTVLNKVYTLKSITYPTKGRTEFNLETNRFSNYYKRYMHPALEDFPKNTYNTNAPINPVTKLSDLTEVPVYDDFTEKEVYIAAYFENKTSVPFTINHKTRVRLEFETAILGAGAKGILRNSNGNELLRFVPQSGQACNGGFESVQGVKLPAGTYTISIENPNNSITTFRANFIGFRAIDVLNPDDIDEFDYQLGGGLRVKFLKNYDHNEELLSTTSYDYTREGYKFENDPWRLDYDTTKVQKSSGKLLSPIRYTHLKLSIYEAYLNLIGGGKTANKVRVFSAGKSFSNRPIIPVASSANGQSIGYDQVAVSKTDGQGNSLGKTVYYYQNQLETVADYGTSIPNEVHLDNGKLLKQETYNSSGVLVSKLENSYSLDDYQPYMYGLSRSLANQEDYNSNGPQIGQCSTGGECQSLYEDLVKYSDYKIKSEWWHLEESKQTIYDLNGSNPLVTTTTYEYGNNKSYQPTKVTSNTSKGDQVEVITYYPDDIKDKHSLGRGGLLTDQDFLAINRLKFEGLDYQPANPIQTETILNENETIVRNHYKLISKLNQEQSYTTSLMSGVSTAKGESDLERQISYLNYDFHGNPLELKRENGTHIYYIWGYQGEYPIAKIENFTSTQAASIQGLITAAKNASNQDNDTSQGNQGKEGDLRDALNNIRNHTALSKAMITTYTYDPLIGITSVTDPRGYTMYYEYDAFNRLKHVKDAKGNLLSKTQYNYKN